MIRLPEFVPILTSFTQRVSGRSADELLASPPRLARALAETQKLIGHDGVLCFFDPTLLVSACSAGDGTGTTLRQPDEAVKAAPFACVLEASRALRYQLPRQVAILTTLTGPALLHERLETAVQAEGLIPEEYTEEVLTQAARLALEGGSGIAVLEWSLHEAGMAYAPCYHTLRKLAEFYQMPFLFFQLPNSRPIINTAAHCVFRLPSVMTELEALGGELEEGSSLNCRPHTTAGDVPATCAVEDLRALADRVRKSRLVVQGGD